MDCNFCYKRELSKSPNGNIYEPHIDNKVVKRVCGNCTQKLLGMKISTIPWEGTMIKKEEESDKLVLRRRKRH